MTAHEGYVWFLPVYVSLKLNETISNSNDTFCSIFEIKNFLNGHFALSYANLNYELNEKIPTQVSVESWKSRYLELRGNSTTISPADYAPFAYDAILVYVKALKELINARE